MTKKRIRLVITLDDAVVYTWYLDDWNLDKVIARRVLMDEIADRLRIAKEQIDVSS